MRISDSKLSLTLAIIGIFLSTSQASAGGECTTGVQTHADWTKPLTGNAYQWPSNAKTANDAAKKRKEVEPFIIDNNLNGCSAQTPCVIVWASSKCGASANGHVALIYGASASSTMADQGNSVGMCDWSKGTWTNQYWDGKKFSSQCSFQRAMQNKSDKSCQNISSSANFTVIHKNPARK